MARCRRAQAALGVLLLSLALCTGSRELLAPAQGAPVQVASPGSTAAASSSSSSSSTEAVGGSAAATGPAAVASPAAAPALPASGPLPAGVVSLAKKKNSNKKAAGATADAANANLASLAAPQPQGTGSYTTFSPIQNAASGQLPAGYTNSNKVAASALAQSQAVNMQNQQLQLASDVTQVVGSQVSAPEAAAAESSLGEQVVVHPTDMQARTVQQVNSDAPTYTTPAGVAVKPVLRTASQSLASQQPSAGGGGGSNSRQAKLRTTTASGQPLTSVSGTSGLDGEVITGDYISSIVGVRIATPLFGTGFNFCIDRYFDSFPKVGIVIPNAGAWLLPEFQDLANVLEHTLDLPTILPHGARVDPTSDGFLLWLPSFQPSEVPDFGIRYGIQIGQAFGYDFGYGIIRDICFVSFVTV